MTLDYSKWDNLELSDDSDIEVHPNVDKKSFIRAKQHQIHQQRFQRKKEIETYKYERIINDGLLKRINGLLTALQSLASEKKNVDELMFQAIMESVGGSSDDIPPPRPEGVAVEEKEMPTYSNMMAALIDQVKAKVDEDKSENRFESYVNEIKCHQKKIEDLQEQLEVKLASLEKEESRLITSESYHTGFEVSQIAKPDSKPTTKKKSDSSAELLNPNSLKEDDGSQSSGTDADVDEPLADGDEIEPSKLGREFSKIDISNPPESHRFILSHPEILAEKESDGLLIMAFNHALNMQDDEARQCTNQALLLQYCRALGPNGVDLFFKRIRMPGHQAQKVFLDDVKNTFLRIKTRAKEVRKQRALEAESGGVETIQLHAINPGSTLNMNIPPKDSDDPEIIKARKLFEAFPPGFQRALESGSLDEVNSILGKMSAEEAEEIVGQLGEGGMLSLENEIIDATTEEGQRALKNIEELDRNRCEEQQNISPDATIDDELSAKYHNDPE
ncbi:unnamed protein product [Blumeria hordei]|uniref:Hsp90 chaperone protein kinase-targeting subunit n=2 Tax=Blumeria hordei TaxID=2867405 RepID=A0A383V311_BLUHO|nr:Hsp90 co-chaperone Cdc37 [Blumeria hordei DH14]SZF06030.1 unnamed protein product [Blumeria hordei]